MKSNYERWRPWLREAWTRLAGVFGPFDEQEPDVQEAFAAKFVPLFEAAEERGRTGRDSPPHSF